MAEVSRCESGFTQYTVYGTPLKGKITPADRGAMQINLDYHGEVADRLGYDLSHIDGNLAYARYLYKNEGTQPWEASRNCWSKQLARN